MTYQLDDVLAAHDIALLADCVWREARGEPYEGKVAVAEVILERWRDRRWPGTIADVVLQPYQFSCYNPKDPNVALRPKRESRAFVECCAAAAEALNGSDRTEGANHYLNKALTKQIRGGSLPPWYDPDKITAEIGRHVFLRL